MTVTPSPQSVVVPVEPTEAMLRSGYDAFHNAAAFSFSGRIPNIWSAMLAAAPAPSSLAGEDGSFRGAEWFGVTGAADETEALAVALFDARCPGIRMIDEDLHYYRAAAQRAMQAVADELDTPALTPRHEAPADKDPVPSEWTGQGADDDFFTPAKTAFCTPAEGAGELLPCPFCGGEASERMISPGINTSDDFEAISCGSCGAMISDATPAEWNRRARSSAPEAREPICVTIFCPQCALPHVDEVEWATTRRHKTHQCQGCGHEWRPFPFATVGVTHPAAPSADKLRIDLWWNAEDWETTFDNIEDAYEAATGGYCVGVARLGRATEHDAVWAAMIDIDTTGDGEADDREIRLFATEDEARQALAALKGGA